MGIFSGKFWLQLFLNTLLTMCAIYIIKKVTATVQIPVVSEVASAV